MRADAASNGEAKDWYASPEMKEIREYIDAHTEGRSFAVKAETWLWLLGGLLIGRPPCSGGITFDRST